LQENELIENNLHVSAVTNQGAIAYKCLAEGFCRLVSGNAVSIYSTHTTTVTFPFIAGYALGKPCEKAPRRGAFSQGALLQKVVFTRHVAP
jgi:hypothetical protein